MGREKALYDLQGRGVKGGKGSEKKIKGRSGGRGEVGFRGPYCQSHRSNDGNGNRQYGHRNRKKKLKTQLFIKVDGRGEKKRARKHCNNQQKAGGKGRTGGSEERATKRGKTQKSDANFPGRAQKQRDGGGESVPKRQKSPKDGKYINKKG